MGNAKTKTFKKPSADTIYPWVIYTEPSETDKKLVRLCLTHQESDRFRILETYYPDEIETAIASATKSIHLRKHMLTMHMLRPCDLLSCPLIKLLCPIILTSRSTGKFQQSFLNSSPGSVLSILGGIKEF